MRVTEYGNVDYKVGLTRGNFDRWGTLTHFSFQHFQLSVTGSSKYFDL